MVVVVSFGASLTLKSAIGVGAWDALAQTGSEVTGIQVGTIGMVLNFICIFIQLIVLKKEFKTKHALQIGLSIVLGYTVNFFYYDVLGNIVISHYYTRILMLIIGYTINAFTVAVLMLLDVVTFALEGACNVVANKRGLNFPILRQKIDIICIVIVILMALVFKFSLLVREGTIIGMILFGPIMGVFLKYLKPIFQKYNLTDYT